MQSCLYSSRLGNASLRNVAGDFTFGRRPYSSPSSPRISAHLWSLSYTKWNKLGFGSWVVNGRQCFHGSSTSSQQDASLAQRCEPGQGTFPNHIIQYGEHARPLKVPLEKESALELGQFRQRKIVRKVPLQKRFKDLPHASSKTRWAEQHNHSVLSHRPPLSSQDVPESVMEHENWEQFDLAAELLANRLSMASGVLRTNFRQVWKSRNSCSSLPVILLDHLYQNDLLRPFSSRSKAEFRDMAKIHLESRGLKMEDVEKWAALVSVRDPDDMADQFLATQISKPIFLLIYALRGEITRVRTFRQLLLYSWEHIRSTLDSLPIRSDDLNGSPNVDHTYEAQQVFVKDALIILRLLSYHCRRLYPQAVVSVASMVDPITRLALCHKSNDLKKPDRRSFHILCHFLNLMLPLLALPSASHPYRSMAHNWEAQKILLRWAGQFSPSLILNQASYRSVAQVLAGLTKSEQEFKAAKLRNRSWPPWRIDQDGMDARRSKEEDVSRVVMAVMRMSEAGYHEDSQDRALKILGGQEPDGTPTIQTRSIVKDLGFRAPLSPSTRAQVPEALDAVQWTARIVATRDVQEAWSAFQKFESSGGIPTLSMFFEMFRKLQADLERLGRKEQYKARHDVAAPGDSSQVLPPMNDNFTEFYQKNLQPPSKDGLYEHMVRTIPDRPQGQFLDFLVANARSPDDCFRYLRDSDVDQRVINFFHDGKGVASQVEGLLPHSTLAAFVSMLCRFVPRSDELGVPRSSWSDQMKHAAKPAEYKLPGRGINLSIPHSLLHVIELLKQSGTHFRTSWYSLFKALSRRGVIINRNMAGDSINDVHCWRIMVAALNDFQTLGLELDPKGFQLLCNVLEKAVLASFSLTDQDGAFTKGSPELLLVKTEFKNLTHSIDHAKVTDFYIPNILHEVQGVHLHAYVRVLGLVEDYEEILRVLQWMIRNNEMLYESACLNRSGIIMMRRVFVAMSVFLSDTEYAATAEELMNSVDQYGWGWPSDEAVKDYIDVWYSYSESAQVEDVADAVDIIGRNEWKDTT